MAVQDWIGSWRLDPQRTDLTFRSTSFWGLMKVKGRFADVTGVGDATGPEQISGHLEVGVASVDTGIRKRDDHLRSADFFDVERFPTFTADVTAAGLRDNDTVNLHVQLTIKGVQRLLDVPVRVTTLDDGSVRLGATTTLNRQDFGVDGNQLGMVGDTVSVEATAVFVKQS
jgi:polyisoprenoid-binding protein YceI